MEILSFAGLPSTNSHALDLLADGFDKEAIIWARTQAAGRGQYGRRFASPAGGLYFSLILRPNLPPERLSLITLAAGVGCRKGLAEHCRISPLLKWPNDLYIGNRKLGGILTESEGYSPDMAVVIGVGLNVSTNPQDFPADLRSSIVSLAECTETDHTVSSLLPVVSGSIRSAVARLRTDPEKILAQWSAHDYLKGRRLSWQNGKNLIQGIGQGLMTDGRYSLRDHDGRLHAILSGSVTPFTGTSSEQPDLP